jgi:hypothetical protein
MECTELLLVPRSYDRMQVYFFHLVDTLMYLTQSESDKEKRFAELLPKNIITVLATESKLPP